MGRSKTSDAEEINHSFELKFGKNHLSQSLLSHELRGLLLASSTPTFHSRVVNVTSAGYTYGFLDLDDVNFTGLPLHPALQRLNRVRRVQDGQHLHGDARRVPFGSSIGSSSSIPPSPGQKIHGYAVHPGGLESPNLQ
ncbi:Short-chain dehydrogenase TIC 32- chloroplastic [Apiospora aurea]|uniref:Short-chain dehydrogenase TIC 32- chloroplastic n=1 Tax=Apiospora aurea TaxID=335848 RepID=A0ABR1Q408_9PEZI